MTMQKLVDGVLIALTPEEVAAFEAAQQASRPTEAEVLAAYEKAVDDHMNAHARALDYDSLLSAISYAEEPAVPKFQLEGQALRAWRSLCWAKCHEVLNAVKAGERAAPTHDELIAELPVAPGPEPLA
jgi:hypothetical protein